MEETPRKAGGVVQVLAGAGGGALFRLFKDAIVYKNVSPQEKPWASRSGAVLGWGQIFLLDSTDAKLLRPTVLHVPRPDGLSCPSQLPAVVVSAWDGPQGAGGCREESLFVPLLPPDLGVSATPDRDVRRSRICGSGRV